MSVGTAPAPGTELAGPKDTPTRPLRVGILGHVGNQNLGDESIIAAVIQNIRRRYPDAEIHGFTLNPADTQERHGIATHAIRRIPPSMRADATTPIAVDPAAATSTISTAAPTTSHAPPTPSPAHQIKELIKGVPILSSVMRGLQHSMETLLEIVSEVPFLRDSQQAVERLDLLIVAGSHQLNDYVGGPWSFPYTLLKWTFLAKRAGAEVVYLSLGAGPIDTWLGRSFIRRALRKSSYRSYRDVTAKRAIDDLGGTLSDEVVPDLAFSFDLPVAKTQDRNEGRLVIGINPMPLYTDYWHETNFSKYEAYVKKLAVFADSLVERGCSVHFIPTQLKVDPPVIRDIRKQMSSNTDPSLQHFIAEPKTENLNDLRSALASVDIMVATRYHGILLSLALEKPVVAIAYHDKSRDLMKWLGLANFVIDGDDFTSETLGEIERALEKERDSVVRSLQEQLPQFRSSVQAQYDAVFELVRPQS